MIPTTSKVVKPGDRFGRYTVLGLFKKPDAYPKYANCQCDCGSPERMVLIGVLRSGASRSCGCYHREVVTTHGAWGKPLFIVWSNMISRCTDPKNKRYARYGGRGISICEEWMDFHVFSRDMRPGFEPGLTIDRRDNDGNYCKDNCRWATRGQQNRNYSRNVLIEHDGKRLCLSDWAPIVGIPMKRLSARIKAGMDPVEALTTPMLSEGERVAKASHARWGKIRPDT